MSKSIERLLKRKEHLEQDINVLGAIKSKLPTYEVFLCTKFNAISVEIPDDQAIECCRVVLGIYEKKLEIINKFIKLMEVVVQDCEKEVLDGE